MKIGLLSGFVALICGVMTFLFGYKCGLEIEVPVPDSCPPVTPIVVKPSQVDPFKSSKFYHFHRNLGPSVVHTVFEEYYHPSSMSSAEFILSPLRAWSVKRKNETKMNCQEMYHTRTGSRTNQPAKCVAVVTVRDGQHSPYLTSHRMGKTAGKVDQYINDYTSYSNRKMDEQQLYPFISSRQTALNRFLSKVGSPIIDRHSAQLQHLDSREMNSTHARRSLIVMVANEGVMNLLLNFICSCVSSGLNPKSIVVFVGTAAHVSVIEQLGVTAVFIPEAGAMPLEVASNYGDNTFGMMMWLKVTSVYLALAAGFDVLFQDADLVWFQDPLPDLYRYPHDISFMDDGARSGRFNPFFANSGFYFMKHNELTRYLMERMVTSGVSEIHRTKSHQSVMTRHLMESTALIGLEITILSQLDYPSGKMFHHNKTYMSQLRAERVSPRVFHMCWTANTQDKVSLRPPSSLTSPQITNFKSIDKWYLRDTRQCSDPSEIAKSASQKQKGVRLLEQCCVNPRVYHDTVKIAEKVEEDPIESEATEEK
jgi:hypothetical protein